MKKIMYAGLEPTLSMDTDGNYNEYQLGEHHEAEYGREWDGDVLGYVYNLDSEDGDEIVEEINVTIHNEPEGAIMITFNGKPSEIYWAEELSWQDEQELKEEEEA